MEKKVDCDVEGESLAANDIEKEVNRDMEGESSVANHIKEAADPDVEGQSRFANNLEKNVHQVKGVARNHIEELDLDGQPHCTNDLEKDMDCEVETESRAANDLEKEVHDWVVPKVGMTFDTVDEAFNYYNSYARRIGFSVRKQRTNKCRANPSNIQLQTLCCSHEGFYDEIRAPKKRRENKRFGCKAMFEIHLCGENNYVVKKFIAEHNHELVKPENLHMLRSQRKIDPSEHKPPSKIHLAVQQPELFSYMCEETSETKIHNSTLAACINLEEKKSVEFRKRDDAQCLVDYFKQKKQENKHYFYSFRANEDFEIRGIFFCDGKSRRDYGLFGDALYFDTTFRTNDYNMVCAAILGINSHGQIILFGCGLLDDETTDAIVWLFTTFLEAMGGKKPKTIFTNQSLASANAIGIVFPETHHRLYLWHIYQTVAKHLHEIFVEFKSLPERFKQCIYNPETVEEFEESWELLLKDYGLRDNEWLRGLYELRKNWAPVYDRVHLCACMTTRQISESIHYCLNSLFGSTTLQELVEQYAKAMIEQRERERESEKETQEKIPFLFSNWSIEHEAAKKYTNKMFCYFQDEYKRSLDQRVIVEKDDGQMCTYKVIERVSKRRDHTIIYSLSEQSASCTCRKLEFHGIVCSHVLKLFHDLEFTSLPSEYYLKRWTRGATDEIVFDLYGEAIPSDIDQFSATCYSELSYISQRIVFKGAKSSTMYSLARSVMQELEAKVEALIVSEEEQRSGSGKNMSGTDEHLASNSNDDAPSRKNKTKRSRGPLKCKVKRVAETEAPVEMTPNEQRGSVEENIAMPHLVGGSSTFYQPMQEPFGLMLQPPLSQDQNQVSPWQTMCLPYNFMGCPQQSNRPLCTSDYLFMSQQDSSAQTHQPEEPTGTVNFPCSSSSCFVDSSTS